MPDASYNRIPSALTRRTFLKSLAAAGAAVTAASALPGCGGGASEAGKVFRWAQANAKLPFDMQRSTNAGSSCVAEAVVEGLLYWNDDLELELALAAEEPSWDETGTVLTVKLKEGVKFHNGADFTAEDVKYTFTRMFRPETAALNTYMYDCIQGAQEMLAGDADELAGLEVVDDYTVAFHLTEPFAQFKDNLGISYAGIFPHEACEEAGSDWGLNGNLIGTGPYKMVSDDGATVTLQRNDEYHGDAPALDGVEVTYIDDVSTKMMSFVNGEIDACDLDSSLLDQYRDDPTVGPLITYYDTLGTYFIVMNLKDEAFQDVRVREALSLAIDRQSLIDSMLGGAATACTCFLAPAIPGSLGKDAEPFAYDPERARQLLAEAGADGLSFTATTRTATMTSILTAVQGMWEEVGVHMEIQQVDPAVYSSDQAAGNLRCFLQSWFPLYPDADNNMYSYFHSTAASAKSSFYSNPEFDALMEQGRAETDAASRAEIYRQADGILTHQDYACLPLYWPQLQFVAKENVHMKCGNLIYHFNDITMD